VVVQVEMEQAELVVQAVAEMELQMEWVLRELQIQAAVEVLMEVVTLMVATAVQVL
jgi:hypothetical protein